LILITVNIASYATVKQPVLLGSKNIVFTSDTKRLHPHFARQDYKEKYLLQFSLRLKYDFLGKNMLIDSPYLCITYLNTQNAYLYA
jgi:hypothetical protein